MKMQGFEFYPDFNDHGPFLDGRAVQSGVAEFPDGSRRLVTLENGRIVQQSDPYRMVTDPETGLPTREYY